jgi:outer membrane receptor protein involved in Fe transport
LGIEGNRGSFDATYHQVAGGDRDEYLSADGTRGDLDTRGESARAGGALYAQYVVQASGALRLSLGGRFDLLHDSFNPSVPSGQGRHAVTHSVLSPKLGLNYRYLSGTAGSGHAWVAVSRSFKAPTLDQKYDLRNIPIPFPPFDVRTSNPDLEPQYGTNVEAGLYHSGDVWSGVRTSVTLAAYRMDMKDELDFDVASFRYVNIGTSRHQGLEAGGTLDGSRASAFASYTLQAPTSRSGVNAGKRLKAIPRHTVTAGLSVRPIQRRALVQATLALTDVHGIYLDDANTRVLLGYTRLDAQVAVGSGRLALHFELRNLLNAKYSSSGFLDPAGSGEAYLYPAAGRVFSAGVRGSW